MQQGALRSGGFTINYSSAGQGLPVLVVGSATYYPRTFAPALQQHLRLIFIDHRGFAKPPAVLEAGSYELDVIASDIEAVRKTFGIKRCLVAGHSGHGYMALHYAAKYPEAVAGLVLLACSPRGDSESFKAADRYFEDSVCPERKALYAQSMALLAGDMKESPARRFIHYSLRSGPRIWFDPKFDAAPLWQGVHLNPDILDYLWGKVFAEIDTKGLVQALSAPCLLGLGRYDYWNPPHLWEGLRPAFKDLVVRVFEKSGHTPQLEEAASFNRELLTWCGQKGLLLNHSV